MTRDDLNHAIAQLRRLNRKAAGEAAWAYAAQLLPVAAEYKTPADLAALLIVAIALYHTAAVRVNEKYACTTFVDAVAKEQRSLSQAASLREIFGGPPYPEKLQHYRQVLIELPPTVLRSAFEIALHGTESLRSH